MPFRLISSSGSNPTYLANVTAASEVFTLPKSPAAGLKITIVREDASGNTVTVQARTGVTLDGTLAGSTTVAVNGEKSFLATGSGKWESIGGGGGGGGGAVSSVAGQTGDISASTLATAVATQPAMSGTYAPKFKATTAYTAGDVVIAPSGLPVAARANFTSGASYSPGDWNPLLGPGSDSWLKAEGLAFNFNFQTVSATDAGTGWPTAGTIRWSDGTTGAFSGGTIDSGGNGYTGFTATWAGGFTKTLTASGTTFDSTSGFPTGTTLAVS